MQLAHVQHTCIWVVCRDTIHSFAQVLALLTWLGAKIRGSELHQQADLIAQPTAVLSSHERQPTHHVKALIYTLTANDTSPCAQYWCGVSCSNRLIQQAEKCNIDPSKVHDMTTRQIQADQGGKEGTMGHSGERIQEKRRMAGDQLAGHSQGGGRN